MIFDIKQTSFKSMHRFRPKSKIAANGSIIPDTDMTKINQKKFFLDVAIALTSGIRFEGFGWLLNS